MFAVPSFLGGPRTRLFCITLYLNELQKVDVRGPHIGAGIQTLHSAFGFAQDDKDGCVYGDKDGCVYGDG